MVTSCICSMYDHQYVHMRVVNTIWEIALASQCTCATQEISCVLRTYSEVFPVLAAECTPGAVLFVNISAIQSVFRTSATCITISGFLCQ